MTASTTTISITKTQACPRGPLGPNQVILALVALLWPAEALAHHGEGGALPQTILGGLISGLAHPVIGIDHLAFVLVMGALTALIRAPKSLPLAFIGSMVLGCVVHARGIEVAAGELGVALSLCLLGGAVWAHRGFPRPAYLGLFVAAGLVHGYAYGESIVGAGMEPLTAYLTGLAVVQSSIALLAMWAMQRLLDVADGRAWTLGRLAATAAAAYGAALILNFV